MLVVGLTGGIASGKSQVERLLAERFPVIDADVVAREVVAPGQPALAAIAEAFGPSVIADDGALDRARMRVLISENGECRERLNQIVHPRIYQSIEAKLEALRPHHQAAFVSAALMIETGSFRKYDRVLLVTAPAELRLARLQARDGMPEALAQKLMAAQAPDPEKRRHADVEIVNDGDLVALAERTEAALVELGLADP
ncbi:dephospho-CoA kinase [Acanthopleuribacter pedis]|uniref:Dephospho-CoA kinase n=1 Tax=Acanthopleuribacter pedis TaxID=442870 RepID=A0A8J7U5T5_9BACT|nr:dephospho-CoA kinase [Acanthopleuribacter pedis]MBO1322052.1 dephospho-CoA kinase [Acanthopleuribacter pedis]